MFSVFLCEIYFLFLIEYNFVSYHLQVILTSGYYAVFRVKLIAKELEGIHDGAVQITTDYEVRLFYIHVLSKCSTMHSADYCHPFCTPKCTFVSRSYHDF